MKGVAVVVAVLGWLGPAQALERWTIDEILKIRRLESPRISPDGRYVAYVLSGVAAAEDRRYADVFVVPANGGGARQLTGDGKLKSALGWAPDSSRIGFLAGDQVWAVAPAGGQPVRLTSAERGVRAYAWSPDGARLLYVAGEPESPEKIAHQKEWGAVISPEEQWPERGSLWVIEVASKQARRLTDGSAMPMAPQWSPEGRSIAFLGGRPQQLYLADPAGGAPQRVTDSSIGVHSFAWSPEGKAIACVISREDPQPYLNLFRRAMHFGLGGIQVLDVGSREWRRLSREDYPNLSEVFWSRGGRRLAFVAKPPGSGNERRSETRMHTISAADGSVVAGAPGLDFFRGGLGITWTADDRELWFVNGERMGYNLFAVDAVSGKHRYVTTGQDCIGEVSYARDFTRAAFVSENANRKPDIYVTELPRWAPRRITDLNPEAGRFAHGPGEIIRYPSEGREIEALLVKPPDFTPAKKYPLILVVHGGPAWYKKNDWRPDWEEHPIQAYAAEGYCLVFPNVRGSADYGLEFRQANYRDLGGGDARDAMAAVDYLIAQGFVDEKRLGVAGWSYGGFLVPAIITRTTRFKAAQFGAGIPSFEAMYGRLSTVEFIVHENYGTRPWEEPEAHVRDSPLYSAHKVKTPTLIEHGEEDPRCPVGGSIIFYKALKSYGVPVVLEIYPKEGHGVGSPLLHRRCLRRNLEWFNKWLKGDRNTSFEKLFPSR